ncbi:hypothetical protein [Emticicia sp. 21SJ11W-3]|uniref:hypothetical protein n=1 Tax=Emticicia sp. 21SJ11W-3 TaxID=2916755 RepID=UPI0020A00BDB|nr:hypothetical protein [Emticicia sp. 21SJ11W-3]UTA67732.1 hypothetical protein MB380_19350 [Emticicia sp. 21SJ11W-3]
MYTIKTTTLLILVLISSYAFSQKNYVDGFIILKNQTDTLKGKIDDLNWAVNPVSINFKNADGPEEIYHISELVAFGISGKESYLVGRVDLDVTPVLKNELLYDRNLHIRKDTLLAFLVLLKSDYSLLSVRDSNNKNHFFYKEGQKITELINHFFLQYLLDENRNKKTYLLNNKVFQKQLEELFSQCGKTIKTRSIEFSLEDLMDKFIEFNECIGCNYTCYVKKKKDKAGFAFGLMAGLANDRNIFIQNYNVNQYFETRTSVPNVLVGINATVSSIRNFHRESFVMEVYLNREVIKSDANHFSSSLYYLNFLPKVRHEFRSRYAFKPIVGIGINAKTLVSYPDIKSVSGSRLSVYAVGEAGMKWKNFLLSANVKVLPKGKREQVSIFYYKNSKLLIDDIYAEKLSFQLNLTYLLYNSANKK